MADSHVSVCGMVRYGVVGVALVSGETGYSECEKASETFMWPAYGKWLCTLYFIKVITNETRFTS